MSFSYSQVESKPQDSTEREYDYMIIEGDTIPREFIDLEEVIILNKIKFTSDLERRRYLILRRKTRKVWPYAKLASERLTELNARLASIESKSERRKYTKIVQKYIEEQFAAELKKLTRTEGQILVKLIHRQTGVTTFQLIKNLRSGWRAFWYDTTAGLFDIELKSEYNPVNNREDFLIEDILQRSFQRNILDNQPSVLNIDYFEASSKWL
ncbi:DUF4294 domain-containing protein [Croceibacter atlanticus]|jgi:hypothetical protein|uniref:DUF4294 domain-containing protein n=1 Tax=Croceibacter atlanticus TaxID=313588 RepID=UPI0030FC763B